MKNAEVKDLIEASLIELLGGEKKFEKSIRGLIKKHKGKTHFTPIKYRVLGGFLQSLNIKFGNFIEILLTKIINQQESKDSETIGELSGKKDIYLELEKDCEREIDNYVNHHIEYSEKEFNKLIDLIFKNQNDDNLIFSKEMGDVDLILKNKEGKYYYVELKYNDDHDTGKFKDINRKFLKTFAGLVRKLKIKNKSKFIPILYYFNQHTRYNNKFLEEHVNIMRSRELFDKLKLDITFQEIETILLKISEDSEEEFDKIREKIFKKVKELD
ncbi:restriction endonuclease [Candidatus Pacearchaeota archaeon]|jgi:hypothetical protein|nr:restriction endonuclease [Candidatus Pacearchaeota archaeon]